MTYGGVVVGANVGDGEGKGVGENVGDAVGTGVGTSEGVKVGVAVGIKVGVGVGARVGVAVLATACEWKSPTAKLSYPLAVAWAVTPPNKVLLKKASSMAATAVCALLSPSNATWKTTPNWTVDNKRCASLTALSIASPVPVMLTRYKSTLLAFAMSSRNTF